MHTRPSSVKIPLNFTRAAGKMFPSMEILILSIVVGLLGGFILADLAHRAAANRNIAKAREEFADSARKLAELHNTSTEAQKSLHNRMESLELILKSSNNQASVMKRF